MRRAAVRLALLALLFLASPVVGHAQQGAAPSITTTAQADTAKAGFVTRTLALVIDQQRRFHRRLAAALEAIRSDGAATASWSLIVISLLYGLFHAAGPGHGKAVLTTYLATHRERLWRGIWLSAAAAFVQGITAILLVFGLTMLAGWAARDTQTAVRWAEQFSFALVAVLGGYLIFRAVAGLRRTRAGSAATHVHAHAHANGHAKCGHAHIPSAEQMTGARDVKAMAGVILSIGIRPCSGAVLVLAVANLFGIPWAGIAAVFAMSLGTAGAVAALALLVLSARRLVTAFFAAESPGIAVAGHLVALAGGVIIVALGAILLAGSFGPAHPLGL